MALSTSKTILDFKKYYILALALLSSFCFAYENKLEFIDLNPCQPDNSLAISKAQELERVDEWITSVPAQEKELPEHCIERMNRLRTQDYISSKGVTSKADSCPIDY